MLTRRVRCPFAVALLFSLVVSVSAGEAPQYKPVPAKLVQALAGIDFASSPPVAGYLASEVRPSPWDVALSVRLGLGAAALLGALLAPILQQASSPGDVVGLDRVFHGLEQLLLLIRPMRL